MGILRDIVRFLLGIFMPLIVILVGAVISGFGLTHEAPTVVYIGLFVIGAGLVWGFLAAGGIP